MPLYDYKCMNCGHVNVDVYLKAKDVTDYRKMFCTGCGKESQFEFQLPAPGIEDWGNGASGRYFEHLSAKGETFHSKKSFKNYLKTHGLKERSAYE